MSHSIALLATLLAALCGCCSAAVQLKEEYAWKTLDFDFCSDRERQHFVAEGLYAPESNFPMGFAVWRDRVFVASPRYKLGVPSSLNYFRMDSDKGPRLSPYPWWSENLMPNSHMKNYEYPIGKPGYKHFKWFVSVMRVFVDKCDRLWALDSGKYNMTGKIRKMYNPSIIVFDLKKDEMIQRHFFDEIVEAHTFFGHMVVDSDAKDCDNSFAYITDLGTSKLFVYDFKQNKSWDVRHHFFNFEPLESQFDIDDVTIRWTDGVASLALSEPLKDGSRDAYFHSTSASNEFKVSTNLLKNETWAHSYDNYNDYTLVGDRGKGTQASISVYDEKNKLLIYSQLTKHGLACWDSTKPLNENTTKLFIADKENLEFPADMKIDSEGNLWVLSNSLHKFLYKNLEKTKVNFKLSKISLEEINKACKGAA